MAARFDGQRPSSTRCSYGKEIADKLFSFTSQARNFLLVFIVLLGVVAILLISNTIRLSIFARKREVEIMKLVGATNWFIRWPFVIEGVTVGFLGAAGRDVVVLVLNSYLVGQDQGQHALHGRPAGRGALRPGRRRPARAWAWSSAPSAPASGCGASSRSEARSVPGLGARPMALFARSRP